MIEKTHTRGNPTKIEWLVNGADRLASKFERCTLVEDGFRCPTWDKTLEEKLLKQIRTHFAQNKLDIDALRKFIEQNQILETFVADTFDVNKTTLRQHLLLTEQILGLLLQLPQPKHLDKWIETVHVQKFLCENIKPIPKLNVAFTSMREIKVDQNVRNIIEFALNQKWDEKKIALEFGVTVKEIRDIVAKM